MNFREMEYLLAISRCQNMTRAAEELYVSQPTLSKFVQRLEEDLELPLFQRVGRQMIPTYAGQRYLTYAERILKEKKALDAEMNALLYSDTGKLRVGMPPQRCGSVLPEILPAFRTLYPRVQFEIMEASSSELDKALLNNEIDVAFYMFIEPIAGIHYEVLEKERMFVILPKNHHLGARASEEGGLPLEALLEETFIIQTRSQRQGQYILRELKSRHLSPASILESSNIQAAAALAANGCGAAFLTGALARRLRRHIDFDAFPLLDCNTEISSVAAWREGTVLPQYALDFVNLNRKSSVLD